METRFKIKFSFYDWFLLAWHGLSQTESSERAVGVSGNPMQKSRTFAILTTISAKGSVQFCRSNGTWGSAGGMERAKRGAVGKP